MDISNGRFYNWRSQFGGMDISAAKRLKALESENEKLKPLLAEKRLEHKAMSGCVIKKVVRPVSNKAVVTYMQSVCHLSERCSCVWLGLSRSGYRYAGKPRDDSMQRRRLFELAAQYPR